jgi:hypothetical protein
MLNETPLSVPIVIGTLSVLVVALGVDAAQRAHSASRSSPSNGSGSRFLARCALVICGLLALVLVVALVPTLNEGRFRLSWVQPFWIVITVGLAAAALLGRSGRSAMQHVPAADLYTLSYWRIVLGVALLWLGYAGRLPMAFAVPAGFGDIVAGLAMVFAGPCLDATGVRRWPVVLANVAGIADLLMVQGLAAAELRPWLIARPELIAGASPMLPMFGVPLFLMIHLAIFARLLGVRVPHATAARPDSP